MRMMTDTSGVEALTSAVNHRYEMAISVMGAPDAGWTTKKLPGQMMAGELSGKARRGKQPGPHHSKTITCRTAFASASASIASLIPSRVILEETSSSTASSPLRHRSSYRGMSREGTAEPR
jgi:hypothetical protein